MWTTRSIQDDIIIEQRKGYVTAEYPPLELKVEGGNEREARDGLMISIWGLVAHLYEQYIRDMYMAAPSIKEMMDNKIDEYWATHERRPVVKDEQYGIVLLEVDFPDELPEVDIVRPT